MIESQDRGGSINKGRGHQEEERANMNWVNDLMEHKIVKLSYTAVLNLNF